MKSKIRMRGIAICLIIIVSVSLLFGCGKQADENNNAASTNTEKPEEENGKNQETNAENPEVEFPLKESVTLSIWVQNTNAKLDNMKDMGMYKEIMKRLGVNIEFIHPVSTNINEQFNLMIASNDWPDIIESVDSSYKGRLNQAYRDEVIVNLNEYADYMPNLNDLFQAYPRLRIESQNEEKKLLAMPMFRGGDNVRTYVGPIFRNDYLVKYGLAVPETIDDWYHVLKTFKNNGVPYPFTGKGVWDSILTGAFGFGPGYYVDNGKVKYGYYDENFKDFILTMRKWYEEGLIDPELFTNDSKMVDAKIVNNKAGAYIGSNSSIEAYTKQMKDTVPQVDFIGVPYMSGDKQNVNHFLRRDLVVQLNCGSSVTTTSEHKEIAVKYLDYLYGKEGHLLANFGVEGESYEMIDGEPKYTPLVTDNPDGLSMAQAGQLYCRAFTMGPFVQDPKFRDQFCGLPRQVEAAETWIRYLKQYNDSNPVVRGFLNADETTEIVQIESAVSTYASENMTKWISGLQPADNFDAYYNTLKEMGVERMIEIKQTAHDRYLSIYPEMKNPEDISVADFYWKN